ncbi:MAG: polysulfide reductase NrfD [Acidobacteriaceae bacterium]|nr:polysulfide reductase NrfD [Acidobacteriaceae bacterium]
MTEQNSRGSGPKSIGFLTGDTDDGRNIDTTLGTLSGEAASQATLATKHDVVLHSKAFPYVPSSQSQASPSYYNQPLLKQPVWIWSIPAYFYVGGVAGVGATLGAAAQLMAPKSMRSLVIRSRWVAIIGGVISSGLLIHDLGRPARFLNMLRVFRVSSPMSMGSWILSAFSSAAGAAALAPFGPKLLQPLGEAAGVLAGLFGLGLSGYTGVLISQTAVPVWQESYRTNPILFLASGAAAAGSFFEFFRLNARESHAVERFALMGKFLEFAALLVLQAEARRVSRVARPLEEGFSGFLWRAAKLAIIAGIAVSVLPGKSRAKSVVSGVLGSAASLFVRFGVFYAGKASARDPRASFEQQRQLSGRPR